MKDSDKAVNLAEEAAFIEWNDSFQVNHCIIQYNNTGNGFWFWRAYSEYRRRGKPIPEHILKKLDVYANALAKLEDAGSSKKAHTAIAGVLELDQKKGTMQTGLDHYEITRFLSLWPDVPPHELKKQTGERFGVDVKSVYTIASKYGLTELNKKPLDTSTVPTNFWQNPFGKK